MHWCINLYHKGLKFRAGLDTDISAAPHLSGDELQRSADGSPGLLAHPLPAAAQQSAACQPGVHPESGHQPGHSPAHPPLLPLFSFKGKTPAVDATVASTEETGYSDQGSRL